jgi:hypothetical protein
VKRHETDALSLIFGLLFVAAATWWGVYQVFRASEVPVTLAVAITLVVVGAVGLFTAVPRRRSSPQPVIPAEPIVSDPVPAPSADQGINLVKREDTP